jgi:hypothetical protein
MLRGPEKVQVWGFRIGFYILLTLVRKMVSGCDFTIFSRSAHVEYFDRMIVKL